MSRKQIYGSAPWSAAVVATPNFGRPTAILPSAVIPLAIFMTIGEPNGDHANASSRVH